MIRDASHPGTLADEAPPRPPGDANSVLILDDRAADRELLATLLGHAGYSVSEAATGDEALALARAEQPDLVITDVLMPGMNGYEFVRRLRSHPDTDAIPVVFCTAPRRGAVRQLAATCGCLALHPEAVRSGDDRGHGGRGARLLPRLAARTLAQRQDFDRRSSASERRAGREVGELDAANAERRKLLGQLVQPTKKSGSGSPRACTTIRSRRWWPCGCVWRRSRRELLNPSWQASWKGSGRTLREAVERLRQPPVRATARSSWTRTGVAVALGGLPRAGGRRRRSGMRPRGPHDSPAQPGRPDASLPGWGVRRSRTSASTPMPQASRWSSTKTATGSAWRSVTTARASTQRREMRVRPGHLGLAAIRERVEIAGGRLKVRASRARAPCSRSGCRTSTPRLRLAQPRPSSA